MDTVDIRSLCGLAPVATLLSGLVSTAVVKDGYLPLIPSKDEPPPS